MYLYSNKLYLLHFTSNGSILPPSVTVLNSLVFLKLLLHYIGSYSVLDSPILKIPMQVGRYMLGH